MSDWLEAVQLQTGMLERELRRRAVLRLIYVFVGFSTMSAGFVLGLLGYSGAVDFELGLGELFRARLGNAAPGLVFLVCGLVVVIVSATAFRIDSAMGAAPDVGDPTPRGRSSVSPMPVFSSSFQLRANLARPFTIKDPETLNQVFNVYQELRAAGGKGKPEDTDWLALETAMLALGQVAVEPTQGADASKRPPHQSEGLPVSR